MIFRKLTATFGSLSGRSLELGEGLNIVNAPNEAGKSTWCAFMRVMLYGLNTFDRDKTGYLSDKSRYRPWSGAPMSGEAEISARGRELTLRRINHGAAPMKDFSAVYTGTGEAVGWLASDTAGETLTGVPEKVFERSAFIRQAGLGVDRSAELEQRISSLVSSGEEGVSFGEAEGRLREWQRKRYVNRSTGRIPQIDKRLAEIDERMKRISEAGERTAELRLALQRLERERGLLASEAAAHKAMETDRSRREISEQELRLKRLSDRVAELEGELTRDGRLLERGDAQALRADCAEYQELRAQLSDSRAALAGLENEAAEKRRAADGSVYAGMSAERARDEAVSRARRYDGCAGVPEYEPKKYRLGYILLAVFFAVCAAAAALRYGVMPIGPLAFALGLASLAGMLVLFATGADKKKKRAAAEEAMAAVLRESGASEPSEIRKSADEYIAALSGLGEAEERCAAARAGLDAQTERARALTVRLRSELERFGADTGDIQAALRRVDEAEGLMDELSALRTAMASEKKLLDKLESLRGEKRQEPAPENSPAPRYGREETEKLYAAQSEQASELQRRIASAEGEARALGDPVVIGAERARLQSERDALALQYDALSAALEELEGANTEIRTRFSPILSRRAGEIASELTGGRYRGLYFDREWHAQARRAEDAAPRDSLYLSAGAADQMYLALRLAICELLLSGEEPCPIVLDDALASFDDARMKNALAWLKKASAGRQVILMTCHSREAEYLSGAEGVRIIGA